MISNVNPSFKGLNFEEIWYFGAGPLSTSNPKLSLGSRYVSPVALTSNLVPWWWAWGFAALIWSLVSEPFLWQDFFWETTASSWNMWLSRWAIRTFQEKTHPGRCFCWGDVWLYYVATHRLYLPTYRQLIYRRYYIIILAKSRIQS